MSGGEGSTVDEVYFEEAGSGEPVTVLLHSSTADGRMWDSLWPALAARSRVIRLDFRGYGRTPYASPVPYSDSGDVAALLARLGLTGVLLVGASYGGQVALEVATAHPERAAGLVLLDAGCGLPRTPDLQAFIAEEDRLLEAGDVEAAVRLNVDTWLGPDAGPQVRERLAGMQRHAFGVQLAADPEPEQVRGRIDLAGIEVPALVVAGAHDLPYFRECARHMAETMPRARLVELDWAGHLPSMERPAEITDLIFTL
ncbi:alpha/beta hydrolase [Spongiactinospora rosea]|uniref:Alpha/beta hydrolase n=1 Tax=Spongiactinospora rosea TaxID=2248750 RepID=A0A366LXW3_9ACTN|nr:alpha/beta hydrolase [Spongiactinospora rosea]RBQ18818.1 alpha/beta hydrolase [Spongiactinospora rosea]